MFILVHMPEGLHENKMAPHPQMAQSQSLKFSECTNPTFSHELLIIFESLILSCPGAHFEASPGSGFISK